LRALDDALFGSFSQRNPYVHAVLPTPPECPKTCAYVERRTAEVKTKKEIIRCLKRYIAREVHASLRDDLGSLSLTP
jgi:hypothetical protein